MPFLYKFEKDFHPNFQKNLIFAHKSRNAWKAGCWCLAGEEKRAQDNGHIKMDFNAKINSILISGEVWKRQ